MAEITAQLVKELRDKTGAGMGDCKKALVETDGNIKEAIEYLRKKGAAALAKRQDRSANEGVVVASTSNDSKKGAIVEINCETDFVAKNDQFVKFGNQVCKAALDSDATSIEELMEVPVDSDTVKGLYNEILAKFSEKIEIRRFDKILTKGYISEYIHAGNKLAVLIEINQANPNEKAALLIKDIAMQVAAMNPLYISRDDVPEEHKQKELAIYKEVAITEGKKEEIAEKIAQGKLNKFYQETCLLDQQFVKDSTKKVADVVNEISKEMNTEVKINKFIRYYLGESLED